MAQRHNPTEDWPVLEGIKLTLNGAQLKQSLFELASMHKFKAALGPEFAKHNDVAALLSYTAAHIEENAFYRIPIEQATTYGLYTERLN